MPRRAHTNKSSTSLKSIKKYVGNAFLMEGEDNTHAYYVLTHLSRYGNTILPSSFTRHFGQQRCADALKTLTGCTVDFRLVKDKNDSSEDYWVLSVEDRNKVKVPPELKTSDFQNALNILDEVIFLRDPHAEQKFNRVVNGTSKKETYELLDYVVTMLPTAVILENKTNQKIIWLDPKDVLKQMYREEEGTDD